MNPNSFLLTAVLVAALSCISTGCGQTGPLVLPASEETESRIEEASAAETAASPAPVPSEDATTP